MADERLTPLETHRALSLAVSYEDHDIFLKALPVAESYDDAEPLDDTILRELLNKHGAW